MAHQAGPIRLKGKLGDLSFYHNKQYGYLVRQKGGPDKEQIATSPKFARTRENATEFAIAAAAGKLIRQAVRAATGFTGDSNVTPRLTGLLVRLGKTDLSNARGSRSPAHVFGDPASQELLRSFVFYRSRTLADSCNGQVTCDTATGSFAFSGIVSRAIFRIQKSATHVRIKAAIASLDFDGKTYLLHKATDYTALLEDPMFQPDFHCDLSDADTSFRMGIVSMEFLQEKNGKLYPLVDRRCMGLA